MATETETLDAIAELRRRYSGAAFGPENLAAYLADLRVLPVDVLLRACDAARAAMPTWLPPAPLIRHHAALILAGYPPEPHRALDEIRRMREEWRQVRARAHRETEEQQAAGRQAIARSCHPLVLAVGDRRRWFDLTGDFDDRGFLGLYGEHREGMITEAAHTGQQPALVAAFARAALPAGGAR